MYAICVVCLVFGIAVIVAGVRASGDDDAAARAFRDDPSCAANLAAPAAGGAAGACRVAGAVILQASEFRVGSVRQSTFRDVVVVRVAGERRRVDLSPENGAAFVHAVANDTPARVQFYRAAVVRVEANGVTAETLAAPDVAESGNRQLPWVGAGIAAMGIVFGMAATALRRSAGPSFASTAR
jgi:hypothetical protein